MVFESVLVDILNRYLRPYVKRLDPSQIKVGVWKGEITGVQAASCSCRNKLELFHTFHVVIPWETLQFTRNDVATMPPKIWKVNSFPNQIIINENLLLVIPPPC